MGVGPRLGREDEKEKWLRGKMAREEEEKNQWGRATILFQVKGGKMVGEEEEKNQWGRATILFSSEGGADTTERLMSSPKCRSVEVINNPTRPGSNHREVNCINYK